MDDDGNKINTKLLQLLPHIVTTNIEHPAIEQCLLHYEKNNICTVTFVPVQSDGRVLAKDVIAAIRLNNNETYVFVLNVLICVPIIITIIIIIIIIIILFGFDYSYKIGNSKLKKKGIQNERRKSHILNLLLFFLSFLLFSFF